MTYAYDDWVQAPAQSLYDTQMMAMAINAAKDMYDRGQDQVKDFYTKYGDFLSPFSEDMKRYGVMMSGVRDIIDDAAARGIDLFKSPEGRAVIQRAVNSVNPSEYNLMRSNAKVGYAYLDAMQDLRRKGKYSEAQELFDIMQTGGTNFKDFATRGPGGKLNTWDRSSPIEATSLLDLTFDSYKGRTPRDLTADDLRAAGIPYDSRYQYTGYLDSDLMKVAPGAAMAIAADPRAAYFRNLAKQKVAARGGNYTQADVDAQFYRDIADANKWALVDPTKKVDEYAKMAQQNAYARELENLRARNDKEIAQIKAAASGSNGGDFRYSPTMNMVVDSEGALRGQLMTYANPESIKVLDREEADLVKKYQDMIKNPSKYKKSDTKNALTRINNASNRRISVGLEGVADEVVKLAKSGGTTYFTDNPEKINSILRDLSSQGATTTTQNLLRELGGIQDEDGGINITRRDRLCGVGEVMEDVLARGYIDGVKHPSIDNAIKELKSGALNKYRKAWTAGSFDNRNWTDSGFWQWGGATKFWPTGNVVTGDKYYYIEVANDPTDHDECCWFRVERDKARGGGINPVLSGITQEVDDSFLKKYSNSNVIGNQQSAVQKYNK